MNLKKIIGIGCVAAAAAFLTGCGGGDNETYIPVEVNYLTNDLGEGISGVSYDCGYFVGATDASGAYEFNPDDYSCEFDFYAVYDNLYIMDEIGYVDGLEYSCLPSGISGVTGDYLGSGGFDYDADDKCVIEAPLI